MKKRTPLVSLMLGALLLAGCASTPTDHTAETTAEAVATTAAAAVTADADAVITLSGRTASSDSGSVQVNGGVITITGAGTYKITGTLSDGMVIVDAGDEDDVKLVLNGADITSATSAAVYIKNCGDAEIVLADGSENTLTNGGSFAAIDENDIDAVLFSKADLALSGSGSLAVASPAGHGVVSKDDLTVSGGAITIDCAEDGLNANDSLTISGGSLTISAGDDGIHADADTLIEAGTVSILQSSEGIEGQTITISGGAITVTASDDGLNAAGGSDQSGLTGGNPFQTDASASIVISGGTLLVNASGDGIDSNGSITMTGGQVFVSGPTNSGNGALDYNGSATITGGTIIAVGASGMAENFSGAKNQGVLLVSTGAQSAGSTITLTDENGTEILSWTPDKAYECVLISAPEVQQGGTYTVTAGTNSQTVTMTSSVYGGMGMGQMGGMGGQMQPGGQMGGRGGMGGMPSRP